MSTWKAFAQLFARSRRTLVFSVALAMGQALLLVPLALVIRHVFDHTIPAGQTGRLAGYGALILGLYVLSAALGLWTRYIVLGVTKRAITRLRGSLLERVYALPRSWFAARELGTVQSTIVQDSERLDVMSNAFLAQLLPSAVIAAALSALLLALNPLLMVLLLVVVPVLVVVTRRFGTAVRGRTRAWQQAFDAFSSETGLALRAISLTKSLAAEPVELAARRRQHAELGEAGRVMAWLQAAYTVITTSIGAIAGVIVLVVGGTAVARGSMTLGELLSFYAALTLLRGQAATVLQTVPQVLAGLESMDRLRALLDEDAPDPYAGAEAIDFSGGLTLESVEFGYDDSPLILGAGMRIDPGECVALVGPNGAGKSTLVALALGLYRPARGRLLADGVPYDVLDMPTLRRAIGVVPQDPMLFPASVRDNIAYGRPEATDAAVREAAGWATAEEWVAGLEEGYDTPVGDDGVLLSGGQRQRIALARALLGRPALLILDEPTLHLDAQATRDLLGNLRDLPWSPSVLLISHDADVAAHAGVTYLLDDGRVRPCAVEAPA